MVIYDDYDHDMSIIMIIFTTFVPNTEPRIFDASKKTTVLLQKLPEF